ncbi:uncharacterized protein DEA37_0007328 [Paragonimus westermani]|uniref:Cadherin domain-containing protein n=1 Tax=Paragonimus westermani TaxID=34504 RepID=A0A5J4P506_9TREM|nr:uncharacterized protein DEA37_0007328 [Paragonimus westermani]
MEPTEENLVIHEDSEYVLPATGTLVMRQDFHISTKLSQHHIDREQLCAKATDHGHDTVISEAMQRCCTARRKECELPLTILVQTKRTASSQTNTTSSHADKQSTFMRLILRLIDINDNAPQFQSPKHQIFVSEGIRVGTRIPLPLAQDLDSLEYGIARPLLEVLALHPTYANPLTLVWPTCGNEHGGRRFTVDGSTNIFLKVSGLFVLFELHNLQTGPNYLLIESDLY